MVAREELCQCGTEEDELEQVTVGIVGDFDRNKHSHWATETSLFHAAAHVNVQVIPRWIATPRLAEGDVGAILSQFDAIWGAPGSPYASATGILRAIEFARQFDRVYLGTCAGFQYALIEFTRNVLGLSHADTAENGELGESTVITLVACPTGGPGRPRLDGSDFARPTPGSRLEKVCRSSLRAEYFCSYETNPAFVARWQAAGLRVAALGANAEMRALELPDKRFFIATLFQPQLSSSHDEPHPLIVEFLRAALGRARER